MQVCRCRCGMYARQQGEKYILSLPSPKLEGVSVALSYVRQFIYLECICCHRESHCDLAYLTYTRIETKLRAWIQVPRTWAYLAALRNPVTKPVNSKAYEHPRHERTCVDKKPAMDRHICLNRTSHFQVEAYEHHAHLCIS